MSTVLEAFKPIAKIANSFEETIITQSAVAFGQFPDAQPADVLGLFNKASAVPLVWAGYISARCNLTYGEVKPFVEAIGQFRSQINLHPDNKVMMIAELLTWDSQVVTPVPTLDRQLSAILGALTKMEEGTVTKDPAKVALLRMKINDKIGILSSSESVPVLQNA